MYVQTRDGYLLAYFVGHVCVLAVQETHGGTNACVVILSLYIYIYMFDGIKTWLNRTAQLLLTMPAHCIKS